MVDMEMAAAKTTPAKPMLHVFEKAGLGKAPFTYLGCDKEHTGCQYCGTAIAFRFWLRSADGKKFYVGSDCIFKSGDAGLRRVIDADVKKYQKEVRDSRINLLIGQFEAFLKANPTFFANDKRPHPFAWRAAKGDTYGDYSKFCYEHAGPSKKASLARQFLIAAGVALPGRVNHGKGKKTAPKAAAVAPAAAAPAPRPAPVAPAPGAPPKYDRYGVRIIER